MKKTGSYGLLFMTLIAAGGNCIQRFQPLLPSQATGYLVVDGIINAGAGPARVSLTRTTMLSDSGVAYESGAAVQVEGSDSSVYPLVEQGGGIYGTAGLSLNTALRYRLRIQTTQNETYLSDFVPVIVTPPIDSISWTADSAGVRTFVSTHDPANNAKYYQWNFSETWEFHAPFVQGLRYDTIIDPGTHKPEPGIIPIGTATDSLVNTCWQTEASTQILLGSSSALSRAVIVNFPLNVIGSSDEKLSVEYSIQVGQFALSADGFNFLTTMQKNTEETGTVFGAAPSALQGNIHSLGNPEETVVGYVGFSTWESKRIFIYRNQLPPAWTTVYPGCAPDSLYTYLALQQDPYYEVKDALLNRLVPIRVIREAVNDSVEFQAVPPACANCTLSGSNIKPSFWQ
jgi:Domain of unknown function (DUF4249)